MRRLTDAQIEALLSHFKAEYDAEVANIIETRTMGGHDDLMLNAMRLVQELRDLRAESAQWRAEADKAIDMQIASMADDATQDWRDINGVCWHLAQMIHTSKAWGGTNSMAEMSEHDELMQYKLAMRDIRHALAEMLEVSINATPQQTAAQVAELVRELVERRAREAGRGT